MVKHVWASIFISVIVCKGTQMCASYTVGLIQELHPLNLSFDTFYGELQWCLYTALTKNDFFVHVRVQVGPARGYVGSIWYHATNARARFCSRHPFLHIICQCLLQGWWHASMSTLNPKLRALTLEVGCNQILMNQFPVLQGCAIVFILFLLITVLSVGWQGCLEHKNRSFQLWQWIHQMPYDL